MGRLTKPVLKFKVYVRQKHGPKTPFFWCSIWRTLPEMRQHVRDVCAAFPGVRNKRRGDSSLASCISWRADEAHKYDMGIIALALAYTGPDTIAHECTHAAFRYCPTIKGRRTAEYLEELYCCVVGEMSRQIVHRLTATVLYGGKKK